MENEKISLHKCPKCGSCGVTEEKSQWEEKGLSIRQALVGYYRCENCHYAWTIELARKIAWQPRLFKPV